VVERIELVVRLVRSKGVGVYFVTQNPLDIPETVLGQLGNRVQHALRAFSPRDQKAVKSAATTMRPNPTLNLEAAITELGVGEALVSLLDEKARPSVTERVYILPPAGQIGPITPQQRQTLLQNSLVAGVYEQAVDRESAYEKLRGRAVGSADAAQAMQQRGGPSTPGGGGSGMATGPSGAADESGSLLGGLSDLLFGSSGPRGARREGLAQTAARSAMRSVGSAVGREIVRGVLGSILGGGRRR
jgi:hypothetical protein